LQACSLWEVPCREKFRNPSHKFDNKEERQIFPNLIILAVASYGNFITECLKKKKRKRSSKRAFQKKVHHREHFRNMFS